MVNHASPVDGDRRELAWGGGVDMVEAAPLVPSGLGGQGGSHRLNPLGQDPLKQAFNERGVVEAGAVAREGVWLLPSKKGILSSW